MRRAARHALLLALGTGALLLAAAWLWHMQQRARHADRLLPLQAAAITRIGVQQAGLPRMDFVRRDGRWWRTGRPAQAAAAAPLDALAAIATAPVQRWLPAAAVQPQALGLAPPLATLWLDGTPLQFGALTPLQPLRYVRLPDGRVALISARYSPFLGTGLAASSDAGTP